MASRFFPFAASVAELISPSADRLDRSNYNLSHFTSPNHPRFRSEPSVSEREKIFIEGVLFSKSGQPRVTYSRHFRRSYTNTNDADNAFQNRFQQKSEEFIPTLSKEGIVAALKKLRSEIFPLIIDFPLRQTRPSVRSRRTPGSNRSAIWEFGSDPEYWGLYTPYLMYNVLLGPYEYGTQLSGTQYITNEDQVEEFDPNLQVPAEMTVEPPQDWSGNAQMFYRQQVITCRHDVGTPNEKYFTIQYQDPPEDVIVAYLRKKRKEYDQNDEQFMFVLFHNLLVPYVFGKTPDSIF
jgi:hypothetical protein